jgi:acetoacetate decarboxylase
MPDGSPLSAGTVSVTCRHGDVEGAYDLLMIMSTEGAVLGGRETFGEPKKVGTASVVHEGDEVRAVMSRKGVDLVTVRGRVAEELSPEGVSERFAFYFKFLLDPEGGRFDADPSMVHVRRTQEDRIRLRLDGEVVLQDSPFDPIADLPVRSVVSMIYSETIKPKRGRSSGRCPPSGCGRSAISATTG